MGNNDYIEEFRHEVLSKAQAAAEVYGEGTCSAYLQEIAEYLMDSEIITEYIPSYFEGRNGRSKIKVDGYSFDEFDKVLTLVISDFQKDDSKNLSKSVVDKEFSYLMQFLDAAAHTNLQERLEPSLPISDLVSLIHEHKDQIKRFQFFLVSDRDKPKSLLNLEEEKFEGCPIEKQVWYPERIYESCCFDNSKEFMNISFLDYCTDGIPCIQLANQSTTKYKSYLGVIPGDILANIYDKYGSKILEGNVRSFLSTKVAVNKKIRNTILKEPEMFFAYNNGISVTVSKVNTAEVNGMLYITDVDDLQIINGGQTTASLASAKLKDKAVLDQINVQMKLTEITADASSADSDELIQNIAKSSNSQNKVSDADFFSSHPFHRRMEQISGLVKAPAQGGAQYETTWFYERARGQFLQEQIKLTPAKKKEYLLLHPKNQLIKKTDLAKVQNCWLMNPHIVSKGAQTNFTAFAAYIEKEWGSDEGQFNEQYYKNTCSLMILFRYLEKNISNASWYQGGYRANVVYYTVSLFRSLLKNQFGGSELDLNNIWLKQDVDPFLGSVLMDLAQLVMESITNNQRPVANVTQWCKREACWKEVQKISYQLPEETLNFCLTTEESKAQKKDAKKQQKTINGINAQQRVVEYPNGFWEAVARYMVKNHLIKSDPEVKYLTTAQKIPKVIPNPFESKKLLEMVQRAEEDGFLYK